MRRAEPRLLAPRVSRDAAVRSRNLGIGARAPPLTPFSSGEQVASLLDTSGNLFKGRIVRRPARPPASTGLRGSSRLHSSAPGGKF